MVTYGKAVRTDVINACGKKFGEEVWRCFLMQPSPEQAMYGRMITAVPGGNILAATQTAHVCSAAEVAYTDEDFFTTREDLASQYADGQHGGAAMMGYKSLVSTVYYYYTACDLWQYIRNAREPKIEDVCTVVRDWVESVVLAMPRGNQTSAAAHEAAEYVRVRLITGDLVDSLLNAYDPPVRADSEIGLTAAAVRALESYEERHRMVYGTDRLLADEIVYLRQPEQSLADLVDHITQAVRETLEDVYIPGSLSPKK